MLSLERAFPQSAATGPEAHGQGEKGQPATRAPTQLPPGATSGCHRWPPGVPLRGRAMRPLLAVETELRAVAIAKWDQRSIQANPFRGVRYVGLCRPKHFLLGVNAQDRYFPTESCHDRVAFRVLFTKKRVKQVNWKYGKIGQSGEAFRCGECFPRDGAPAERPSFNRAKGVGTVSGPELASETLRIDFGQPEHLSNPPNLPEAFFQDLIPVRY